MLKQNLSIAIVRSTVPSLSSLSIRSAEAMLKVLNQNYKSAKIVTANSRQDLDQLIDSGIDVVFAGLKYLPDKIAVHGKVWLSDFCYQNGICYTGSDSRAHLLESNKALAKTAIIKSGIASSAFFVARQLSILPVQKKSCRFRCS